MEVLEFFQNHNSSNAEALVKAVLGQTAFWGQDLNQVAGLTEAVTVYLEDIRSNGMRKALCKVL